MKYRVGLLKTSKKSRSWAIALNVDGIFHYIDVYWSNTLTLVGTGNKAVFSLSPYYSGRIIYIAKDITQYIKPELGVHGHVKRYTVNYAGMSQLLSSMDNVGQKRGASIYGEPI